VLQSKQKKDLGQRSFGCKLQIQFLENYAEILKLPEKYYMLENIIKLETLYKRDTKGKVRVWEVEYGQGPRLLAGTRTISGTQDGQKVTSEWNMSAPKNVGKANETTALSQAKAEAQALWDKRIEKEYFKDVDSIDSYEQFKPMLAHDYTKRHQDSGWSQPKLDGIRCVVDKNGMWTRSGKPINSCPHIWDSLKDYMAKNPDHILDGELYNHELKADFNKIISMVRKVKSTPADIEEAKSMVQYHVYDMFDKNVPDMKFISRVKQAYFAKNDYVHIVATDFASTQEELDILYSDYTEQGYEGQMVRNDTPYENKRSKNLLKRKEFITEEFKVIQVLEGQGNWSGYAKKFVLELADGRQFGSGVRGQQAQLKALWESKDSAKGLPSWATCRYFDLTPDGVPRFPVIVDYGIGERTD
jgi:DNA ligase-1